MSDGFPVVWDGSPVEHLDNLVSLLRDRALAGRLDHPGQSGPTAGVFERMRADRGLAEPVRAAAARLLAEGGPAEVDEFTLRLWRAPWRGYGFHQTLLERLEAETFDAESAGHMGTLLDDALDHLSDVPLVEDVRMRERAARLATANGAWVVLLRLLRLSQDHAGLAEALGRADPGSVSPDHASLIARDLAEADPTVVLAAASALRSHPEDCRLRFFQTVEATGSWMGESERRLLRESLDLL